MKTNSPGIFIPFFEDVNLLVYSTQKDKFVEFLSQREQYLSELLQKSNVPNEASIACRLSFQPAKQSLSFELGCLITLMHPHQMEYLKALQILQTEGITNFKTDEYSVPLNSVAAAGLGQVTKTLYCYIAQDPSLDNYKYHFIRLSTMLSQLYKQNGLAVCILLMLEKDHLSLQATSPIVLNNNYHAWQQYLGKALRNESYAPVFYSTWSTNTKLAAYYKEKSRQLQEKQQRDYAEKIAARNR